MERKPFFTGTLPLPPGINQSYKIVTIRLRDGRKYNTIGDTAEAATFKKASSRQLLDVNTTEVDWCVAEYIELERKRKHYIPLIIKMTFYFPTLWKRDVDGGGKHVQDAVCKHLGIKDNLIVKAVVEKYADRDNPRVETQLFIQE